MTDTAANSGHLVRIRKNCPCEQVEHSTGLGEGWWAGFWPSVAPEPGTWDRDAPKQPSLTALERWPDLTEIQEHLVKFKFQI